MIFYYNQDGLVNRGRQNNPELVRMSWILMMLKNKSGFDQYDDEFYNFIYRTYNIDVKFNKSIRTNKIITSIEFPDEIYTMLLLMYETYDY